MRYFLSRLCVSILALGLLSACGGASGGLDALQKQIQEEVVKQGASSVKQVMCESPKSGDEKSILCTGLLESGSGFEIPVQKQDDQSYKWEILSIKGLLNMPQIQQAVQDGLKAEIGEVALDCGVGAAIYKVSNPGDTFDCQFKVTALLADKKPGEAPNQAADPSQSPAAAKVASGKSEADKSENLPIEKSGKVTISIMPSGDINWQRVVAGKSDVAAGDAGKSAKAPSDAATKPDDASKPAAASKSDAVKKDAQTAATPSSDVPAPAANADDALNQGAADQLED